MTNGDRSASYSSSRYAAGRSWLPAALVLVAVAICLGLTVWLTTRADRPERPGELGLATEQEQPETANQTVAESLDLPATNTTSGAAQPGPPDTSQDPVTVLPSSSTSPHPRGEPNRDDLPAATSTERAAQPGPAKNARQLVMIRKHFDETVWRDEVTAQKYGQTIVNLWDALIWQEDKYKVLRDFAFSELIVGRELSDWSIDWGIHIREFRGPARTIRAPDWPKLLALFEGQGYQFIESEWHHDKFDPPAEGQPAKSVVSFAIHVERPSTSERFILRGNLKITWATAPRQERSGGKTKLITANPGTIDARDVKIIHRRGDPAFRTQMVKEFERDSRGRAFPPTIHPVILHDLNDDGLPEIVVGGYNLVYWNQGNWRFRPRPLCDHPVRLPSAGIFADLTGDGVTDYLCCPKNGHAHLYEGQPGGKFAKRGRPLEISDEKLLAPTSVTAGDIDGDGDLDLYVGQLKPGYHNGDMPTPFFDARDSFPNYLLRNDGQGDFRDVTIEAGLGEKRRRRNFSATFVDLDEDGDLDLMLTNDFAGTDLFYNDGHGHFTDVTERMKPPGYAFGMSHTLGDYNLDGQLDFLVIGMSEITAHRLQHMNLGRDDFPVYNQARSRMGYGNRLFYRDGENFVQAPFNVDVVRTGWSWGSTTLDFDGDGDHDFYIANGQISGRTSQDYSTRFWCHDIYYRRGERPDMAIRQLFSNMASLFYGNAISWSGFEHNVLVMNLDGKDFINVGFLMGVSFEFDARCTVSGDLDGDGRVDLVVERKDIRNQKSDLYVMRNQWSESNHWIGVHLRGNGRGGPSPLGARVTFNLPDGRRLVQRCLTGHAVWAQHPNTIHYGLGKTETVRSIEVLWPDGTVSEINEPAVDTYHVVRPAAGMTNDEIRMTKE